MLDQDLCQPRKCGLECIIYCPVNKTGGECIIQRPDDGKAVISEDLCTGCTICIKKCPFDAIVIVNLAQEIGVDKIHQYGINSFRLYKIPVPKEGTVTGLVGRNGMGKSTIINLLSGNMRPNFGEFEKAPSWDEILKRTTNIELRKHFEKIQNKTLRTSIKPVMQSALDEYKLNEQWAKIMQPVKGLLGERFNLDLSNLMAGMVSEAMFRKIEEKERQVRNDANARSTQLLQKVFSRSWN